MQFKLTIALALSALAAAVPTEYSHDARGHAAASIQEAGRAIEDTGKATVNVIDNNLVQPAVHVKDAAVDGAIHAKNVAVDGAVHAKNVAVDGAVHAKDKAIDAKNSAVDTAAHLAHETEKTTPVQGVEASGNWAGRSFNSALASVNGYLSRFTGRISERTAQKQEAAEQAAESYDEALQENKAQMHDNIEARKQQFEDLKENAEARASNAKITVEEKVIEPVVEVKNDVSERASSSFGNFVESAQQKFNNIGGSIRSAINPSRTISVELPTVNGTYTRIPLNNTGEIVNTTITEEIIYENNGAPNVVLENSAAGLSLAAVAVLVSVQLLI